MSGTPPNGSPTPRRSGGVRADGTRAATTYAVEIGGESITVTVTPDGVTIDGVTVPASVVALHDSPIHLLRVGDAVYELLPERTGARGAYALSIGGSRVAAEALDERSRAVRSLRSATAVATGPEPIRAPMPGLVTRILVGPGDVVAAGASLIVMEAMKMENELRAKVPARVRRIAVEPGTAVEKGTLLVELEETGGPEA